MTGAELRSIRLSLGLTQVQFGKALGYRGSKATTIAVSVARLENDDRPVPELREIKALMLLNGR